jgi:hypothetical protein
VVGKLAKRDLDIELTIKSVLLEGDKVSMRGFMCLWVSQKLLLMPIGPRSRKDLEQRRTKAA